MPGFIKNNKSHSSIFCLCFALASLTLLSSCSSPLPRGHDTIKSPWNSFSEVKDAYDKINLHVTDIADLQELGFDPYSTPNVKILSYLDIIEKFSPNNLVKQEDLPPSVNTCLSFRELCIAYEASPGVRNTERVGSLVKDLLKFERKQVETGWSFNALIVIDRDIAVYKIWNGVPIIDHEKSRKNPLGPIQGSAGSMAKDMAGF